MNDLNPSPLTHLYPVVYLEIYSEFFKFFLPRLNLPVMYLNTPAKILLVISEEVTMLPKRDVFL